MKKAGQKKMPSTEVREVNPKYPHLDTKGRLLPGYSQGGRGHRPIEMYEKKKAIQEAATVEMTQALIVSLHEEAMKAKGMEKGYLSTIYFNYVVGKPTQNIELNKHEVTMNIDYSHLSDQELETLDVLMNKARPVIVPGMLAAPENID